MFKCKNNDLIACKKQLLYSVHNDVYNYIES